MKHTFTKPTINAETLANEIQQALPLSEFQNIEYDYSKPTDNLTVAFNTVLSEPDITTLTNVVTNHTP